MRRCDRCRHCTLTFVMGLLFFFNITAVQAATDRQLHENVRTGGSDSMLLKQATENWHMVSRNGRILGSTRILMGTGAFLFSAMPYGIAQIVSGKEMVKGSGLSREMPSRNLAAIQALVVQNRWTIIEQQRWAGRTRLGLGGMLLTYGLAGTAGTAALWFATAYDRAYLSLAIGATILDAGFYMASVLAFKSGRRDIVIARQAKQNMNLQTNPAQAIAENRRLILESQKRIGALRMAMGASVLVIAAGGAAATVMTWVLTTGFERNTIGTVSAIATLGAGFLGGYLLVTGSGMRKEANLKSITTTRTPRFMLQPIYAPATGIYSSIWGLSFSSEF